MKKNNQNGVTLLILVVMIIIMAILASITVYAGTEIVKKAQLENLKTNMLLIQAKTKEYVEEVNFKMGTNPDETKRTETRQEIYENEGKLTKLVDADSNIKSAATKIGISESAVCYYVSDNALENMGLNQLKEKSNNYYLVEFDEANGTVEIYYTKGYLDNGVMKYSLTDIDKIEE